MTDTRHFLFLLLLLPGLASIPTSSRASDETTSVQCLDYYVLTGPEVSQLALQFDHAFPVTTVLSDSGTTLVLRWDQVEAQAPPSPTWQGDRRIAAVTPLYATDGSGRWLGLTLQAATVFDNHRAFWNVDPAVFQVEVSTLPVAPVRPSEGASGADRTLQVLPAAQRPGPTSAAQPVDISAYAPMGSAAQSLRERERELDDYLLRMARWHTRDSRTLSDLLDGRLWKRAAHTLAERVYLNPQADETLNWLFFRGELLYRDVEQGTTRPNEAIQEMLVYQRAAPDDHLWQPYAYYRLSQLYRILQRTPEEVAALREGRRGSDTPFEDLFLIREAQVESRQADPMLARLLIQRLTERYPLSPLRTEAEYLLGEMAWREASPGARVRAYEHFQTMAQWNTSPLDGDTSRTLIVATAYAMGKNCEGARDLLAPLTTRGTFRPSRELGAAWLALAECVLEAGDETEAARYFGLAENPLLPLAIRQEATLLLAQMGHQHAMEARRRMEQGRSLRIDDANDSGVGDRNIHERSDSPTYQSPLDAAVTLYQTAIDPELAIRAGFLWGRILYENDQVVEAIHAFLAVREAYGDSPLRSTFERFIVDSFQEAVATSFEHDEFDKVIRLFKASAPLADALRLDRLTRHRHAASLRRQGYHREAADIWLTMTSPPFPEGVTPHPSEGQRLLLDMADSLQKGGRPGAALETLTHRERLYPDVYGGESVLLRARCYQDLDDTARAIQALEQARRDPGLSLDQRTTATIDLAAQYREQRQLDMAAVVLNDALTQIHEAGVALETSPAAARLMEKLADFYYSLNQAQSAILVYERYVRLYPQAANIHMARYRLAQLYLGQNREAAAVALFETLSDDPQGDRIYSDLARNSLENIRMERQMGLRQN